MWQLEIESWMKKLGEEIRRRVGVQIDLARRWFEHDKWINNERIAKRVYESGVEGKRGRGRPRKSYHEALHSYGPLEIFDALWTRPNGSGFVESEPIQPRLEWCKAGRSHYMLWELAPLFGNPSWKSMLSQTRFECCVLYFEAIVIRSPFWFSCIIGSRSTS